MSNCSDGSFSKLGGINVGTRIELTKLLHNNRWLILKGLVERPVTQLSVGQQQRVAAARALLGEPEVIIADEPTSSLDMAHRASFLELLTGECARIGATLIFVSHDTSLQQYFDRRIDLPAINQALTSQVEMP